MLADHIPTIGYIKNELHSKYGGRPLYILLSGSHLYGFDSADSDFDYRGVFIANTNKYLGIYKFPDQLRDENKETGLDLVIDEIGFACNYILKSNCNFLEHLFGDALISTPEQRELRKIVENGGISRTGIADSYKGMSMSNYDKFILRGASTTSKKYLYVFRGLLSGLYALRTGKIEPNITKTGKDYPEVMELVNFKRNGGEWENVGRVLKYDKIIDELLKEFEDAETTSNLPDIQDITTKDKLNDWLKKQRIASLDTPK